MSELQAEVCREHVDKDCKTCDQGDDDLWINPRDLGACRECGNRYDRDLSFYDDESLCPACGDAQEEAAANYTPPPRVYEQCKTCGATRTLTHHCDLTARLRAFARDCVEHGDMTPTAQRMLHSILDLT